MAPAALPPAWQPGLPGTPGAPPFYVPPTATPPARVALLVNTAEGGTSGVTPTPANTGGVSGAAFDVVSVTGTSALTFDNTQAAHGTLSYKILSGTAANAALQWTTSAGPPLQTVFFRVYAFFTAWPNPASRLLNFRTAASGECAGILISTAGIIQLDDAGFVNRHSFTTTVPVGQWFRLEGYVTGDPAAGVISCSLYKSMDSVIADESFTATGLNTAGPIGQTWFGEANSTGVGPYWIDEVGVSNTGPLGPFAVTLAGAGAVSAAATQAVTAAVAGAGSVTANATVIAGAAITGAASVAAAVTQAAPAVAAGAAAVSGVVTQAVTAAPAGAAVVTDVVTQAVTGTAAGAAVVTAKTVQAAGAAAVAAGAVAGVVTEAVTAAPAGAGVVTANGFTGISGTAALAGAASVTATAVQGATAAATAAAVVTAKAGQPVTAALPAAGSVTALVTQKVTGAAAAAAAVNATGIAVAPFTVGVLSAATTSAAALTAEIAASGDSIYTSLTYTAAYQAGGTPVPRLTTSTDAAANLGAVTSAAGVPEISQYAAAYATFYGLTPGGALSAADAKAGGPR